MEPALAALGRVLPVAGYAGRFARRLAVVGALAAAVLTYALFRDGIPGGGAFVLAALLYAPAVVLGLFWRACEEVVALPARLRALPGDAVAHSAELAELVRRGRQRKARSAWRLLRLSHAVRELLTPYAPLVALLSPTFLVATGLAAVATALEALVALVVLVAAV